MITPCVYKRGLIWLVFLLLSLIALPYVSGPETPYSPPSTVQMRNG